MRNALIVIAGFAVALGVGAVVLYLNYGSVAPCGILRARMREQAVQEGGRLGSFLATAMPDNVLDGVIAAQYGALSPGRCIRILLSGPPPRFAPAAPPRPAG